MKHCTRCVLPETFPGIRFNEDSVCNFCLNYRGEGRLETRKKETRERFEELAGQVRTREGFHCVLAFSGGKDSTYTLQLLRDHYDLRVLAVTFDNGFISPQSFVNIRRVIERVGADGLIIKPQLDLVASVFRDVSDNPPYPMKALERASSVCNACIGLVKNTVMRVALEQRVPLVAFGWSPGQAPITASLFQMNAEMLQQMHDVRSAPLRSVAGGRVSPYLLEERHLAQAEEFPYNVNLLAFHDYGEHEILEAIAALGWEAPEDTDGNSTNCLLNTYANRLHLERYGFHPYAFEVAGLVRAGAMTRDEGLENLADLGSEDVLAEVRKRLGVQGA